MWKIFTRRHTLPVLACFTFAFLLSPMSNNAFASTWSDGVAGHAWYNVVGATYQVCTDSVLPPAVPYEVKMCESAHTSSTDGYYAPSTHGWSSVTSAPAIGDVSGTLTGYFTSSNGARIVARRTSDNVLVTNLVGGSQVSGCHSSGWTPSGSYPPPAFTSTLTCDTGYTLYGIDRIVTGGTQEQRYVFGAPPAPGTACSNVLTDVEFSRVSSGIFDQRIHIGIQFYRVNILHPAPSSTSDMTSNIESFFDSADAVPDSPGYYFQGNSNGVGGNANTFRLVVKTGDSTSSSVYCYMDITATNNGHLEPGGNPGSATDPDDGLHCGLNIFCYIKAALKWAFTPGAGTFNQWASFQTTLASTPPFSLIASLSSYVGNIFTGYTCSCGDAGDYNLGGRLAIPAEDGSTADEVSGGIDFLGAIRDSADNIWWQDILTIMRLSMWALFAWWAFNRVTASFGGKNP